MRQVEFWNWWLPHDWKPGKRVKSSWKMTAETAAGYPGAERVEGTMEIRTVADTEAERAKQSISRHHQLAEPKKP